MGIATHPIQLALGVRHGRYVMVEEDAWHPPKRGFSAALALSPGTYDVELAFTLFDASHLRALLLEMIHGFRAADPFGEVRIMEYQHQTLKWHAARESREVVCALKGPLIVPSHSRTKAESARVRRKESSAKQPARPVRAPRMKLSPHRILSPWLKEDHPCLDGALWLLTGRRRHFNNLESRHEAIRSSLWKSAHGSWCSGNQGDSLKLASRTLIDYWSARLLRRWKYVKPHHRIWSTWPYRPATSQILWPREKPQRLATRPWSENRSWGDIELSTTHRLTAAAVASWLCGHQSDDLALKRKARQTILGWVLPRQEDSGFWHYTPDRWPGQEGFHCEVVSHLGMLLEFDEWRRCRPLVTAFSKALEFQESNLAQSDGSYLGFPWHSDETLPDDPYHLGYRVAFTLYATEAMAAASRFLGQDWSLQISDSVGWLYENFGTAVESGGPPLKRILSPALRSLLLMPLQGFAFRPASGGAVRVNSSEASSPF
jgi:hypothetical protein